MKVSKFFTRNLSRLLIYADGTAIFLKNTESYDLQIKDSKCELDVIGALKGIKVTICGMGCVKLHEDTIKILEIL